MEKVKTVRSRSPSYLEEYSLREYLNKDLDQEYRPTGQVLTWASRIWSVATRLERSVSRWTSVHMRLDVALYKTGDWGEFWCGTVKDWRVHMSSGVTLYRVEGKGEVLCGSIQHPKLRVNFVVALYKTGTFRWVLVWHYTRLENTDEVCGGTVQDWRVYGRFGVALYKTKSTDEVWCCTIQD